MTILGDRIGYKHNYSLDSIRGLYYGGGEARGTLKYQFLANFLHFPNPYIKWDQKSLGEQGKVENSAKWVTLKSISTSVYCCQLASALDSRNGHNNSGSILNGKEWLCLLLLAFPTGSIFQEVACKGKQSPPPPAYFGSWHVEELASCPFFFYSDTARIGITSLWLLENEFEIYLKLKLSRVLVNKLWNEGLVLILREEQHLLVQNTNKPCEPMRDALLCG